MLANVLIDFVVGLVPWIGDILDVFYKSNQYNLTILSVRSLLTRFQGCMPCLPCHLQPYFSIYHRYMFSYFNRELLLPYQSEK